MSVGWIAAIALANLALATGDRGPELLGGPGPVVATRPIFEGARLHDPDLALVREEHCFTEKADPIDARSWRLAGGPLLIALPCRREARDASSLWVLRDGAEDRVLMLPLQGSAVMVALLPDSTVDPARGLITATSRAQGFGDCTTRYAWGWTGEDFRLVELAVKGPCVGYMSTDWKVIYRARVDVGD